MDDRLQQRCDDRFRRLERAARRRLLVHTAAAALAFGGLLALLLVAVLGGFEPPRWVRLGLAGSGVVLFAAIVAALARRAWRAVRSRAALARHCDRAGGLADTLGAAEEALRRPDRWRADTPVRRALIDRLLARSSALLAELALPRLLPVWRPGTVFALLLLVLAGAWWLESARPEISARGARALREPWRAVDPTAPGSLRLVPGPPHVVAGADVTVAVLDLHGGGEPAFCEVRAGSGLWRPHPAVPAVVPTGGDPAAGAPYERWETTLRQVGEDLVYRFRRGSRVSPERALAVLYPPLLLELAARIEPPAYTGLPAQDLPRLPAYLEVPVGSRLLLDGRASQPLAAAVIVSAGGDTLDLVVRGDTLRADLQVDETLRLQPDLLDERGLRGRSELVHEVAVIADRVPTAALERPDGGGDLPLTASLRLVATAEDDYGLTAVALQLRRGGAAADDGWQGIDLVDGGGAPRGGRREVKTALGRLGLSAVPRPGLPAAVALDLVLEPENLALVPGDVLELRLEARDNRRPGPPGVGRSAVLRLQVPSSLEILRAREEAQIAHRDDLDAMRRRSTELGSELERLRRELLRNPIPDWDRRQRLQATLERQHQLEAELSRLAEAMQQDLESLAEQRLAGPQLLERMDRLAELLAGSGDQAMQELLERMRESLGEMSPRELAEALQDFERHQRDLLRRLDMAMAMLRDLDREQQMEGLTELAAELIRKQQELAERQRERTETGGERDQEGESRETGETGESAEPGDAADRADRQDTAEELARRQEALAKELADLEQRLREALAALDGGSDEDGESGESGESGEADRSAAAERMREALAEALQRLEQQETGRTMQDASESLAMLPDEALEQMQQALSDLAGLYHVLLRSQVAMQMAMQQEQGQNMRNLAADLLALSERQEQLGLDLPTSLRDVRADDLARRQHVILQGTIGLHAGLQEVAAAAPREFVRMLEALDELIAGVGQTLSQIQEGRVQPARQRSDQALAGMNQLVIQLLTQAQMTMQGGGAGSSQPQLSQQLQQMAEEQAGLNALADQLRRQQNRLTEELRAGMQRLQQDQRGLAGQARELAEQQEQRRQEQQEGGRPLGDLDQLARDMERVGDELAGGLVTEETLRRQERILSRLLDMHNAARERDWSRRRESRTADDVYAEQEGDPHLAEPDGLPPEARRWRAIEDAPTAYRDLVRDYFREIQRLHESTGRGPDGRRPGGKDLP